LCLHTYSLRDGCEIVLTTIEKRSKQNRNIYCRINELCLHTYSLRDGCERVLTNFEKRSKQNRNLY